MLITTRLFNYVSNDFAKAVSKSKGATSAAPFLYNYLSIMVDLLPLLLDEDTLIVLSAAVGILLKTIM